MPLPRPFGQRGFKATQFALTVLIVFLAAMAAYVSAIVFDRQQALEKSYRYNVAFSAAQGMNEYVRLRERLAEYLLAPSPEALREVRLRFDILASRLDIFRAGQFDEFVGTSAERRQVIAKLKRTVGDLENMMANIHRAEIARRALEMTSPLEGELIGLASEADHYGSRQVAEDQRGLLRLHWIFSLLALCLVVCAFVFLALVRWQNHILVHIRRWLRRSNDELRNTGAELRSQNVLFDTALNNMTHGLCMFDAEGKMIVSNRQFSRLYGCKPGCPEPGTGFADFFQAIGLERHSNDSGRTSASRQRLEAAIARGIPERLHQTLPDGRMISLTLRPVETGGWIITFEDISERHRAQERIEQIARHDALTGLPNRILLRERLENVLATDSDPCGSTALLCLDLDNFKKINDTHGHPTGDAVLREVGRRVRSIVPEQTLVCRIGGDEFVVVVDKVKQHSLPEEIAARIVVALAEPFEVDGVRILGGTSVGIALSSSGMEPDELIRNADIALYDAKRRGRGAFSTYSPQMSETLLRRNRIEAELLDGDFDEKLDLVFQPIVDLRTGQPHAVEALLRWKTSRDDDLTPLELVSIAEDTGAIVSLGRWILEKACRQALGLPEPVAVSVNLSPIQFRQDDIVATVFDVLSRTGLEPKRLHLEITETLLLDDECAFENELGTLRRAGIGISLDDFGTGYSSLSYLRKFSVDRIKIDRIFVEEIDRNPDRQAIVAAIVHLARGLGMRTIAEGVETESELQILRATGCNEVQGFLISKPLGPREIVAYFQSDTPSGQGVTIDQPPGGFGKAGRPVH
ncbi:putative bifunctional diguanylate cyclase/phosphodiesterase [Oricola cellulosilytica]|uniref:EAL domain-containing protein n=1 Tax=Oricola cellulosilytica TaxID=1429082 RepID=A0A4R0PFD8_9HYPH|nr:EAL domain-containing protein [Oricola cellulosilytica]TCD16555.1 EAL domain-containing protein [Oricola cellulosilytica]